jgi:hypothetical protein
LNLFATTCVLASGATLAVGIARRQHARRRVAQHLGRIDVSAPLAVEHLSPALARLTVHARTLRLQLQTPVHRYLQAPVPTTPWGRRQIFDEYDLALIDARRALWEWIGDVRRLAAPDRLRLARLGVDLAAVGQVFAASDALERTADPWDQGIWPRAPNVRRVAAELARAIESLGRFETTMLAASFEDPYR